MDQEDRLAALEGQLQELKDRSAIEDCARRYNGDAEASLVRRILTSDIVGEPWDGGHSPNLAGEIDLSFISIEFETTALGNCVIEGQSATAESVRIGIYFSRLSDRRHVVSLRLRDVLKRTENGWEVVARTAALQAALLAERSPAFCKMLN